MEASPRFLPDIVNTVHGGAEQAAVVSSAVTPIGRIAVPVEGPSVESDPQVIPDAWVISGPSIGTQAIKRFLDVVLSLILLVVLAPIALVAAIAVRLDSKGPILFGQTRYGRNGTTFTMLKFRSMSTDAEERLKEMAALAAEGALTVTNAPAFKSAEDPRITRVGAFLRRTNVDELPQLINVLRGEMSLVGPRPLVECEVSELPRPVAEMRHSVRPGLTCQWQVERTANTTFDERMNLDLEYVRQQSTYLDLRLLLMTPVSVLRGEGSH